MRRLPRLSLRLVKLFLATVGFGLLHGFFFLPALLQLSYSAR